MFSKSIINIHIFENLLSFYCVVERITKTDMDMLSERCRICHAYQAVTYEKISF